MKRILFLMALVFIINSIQSRAEDFKIDFFTGYGYAKIKNPKNYEFYTFIVDFTKPIRNSRKFFFQIEPSIAYVKSPSDNFEVGVSFFGLYRFSEGKIQPYIKIGTGIIYLSTDFVEQSTHFNFASSACIGLKFDIKNFFIYMEGRLRHVSNAGIKEPNEGVNSKIFLIGIGYNF